MKILAIGDVVNENGLQFLKKKLRSLIRSTGADFTVANGENAAGTGLLPRQAQIMLEAGVDLITLGNHAFRREQLFDLLDDETQVLRPLNFAPQTPGRGWAEVETGFGKLLLVNLIGRCGMDFGPDNPFLAVDKFLKTHRARFILVDFHAEATSEKLAMAYYLDGRVSALWGTHTHVQTADAEVFPKGTGYITDLGMTGAKRSVLGVKPEESVNLYLGNPRQTFNGATGACKLEGAVFTLDNDTGLCTAVEPLRIED